MTVDEELSLLEDSMRKLKIEYDMYFGGGAKRAPFDAQWRVDATIKRLEGSKMNFTQRFKLNSMTQRYAMFSDMWRVKVKRREEGTDGPRGRRVDTVAPPEPAQARAAPASFKVQWQDPERDHEKVGQLFNALIQAKKQVGDNPDSLNIDGFTRFVKQK